MFYKKIDIWSHKTWEVYCCLKTLLIFLVSIYIFSYLWERVLNYKRTTLNHEWFCPLKEIINSVGRHFWLSQLRGNGAIGIWCIETWGGEKRQSAGQLPQWRIVQTKISISAKVEKVFWNECCKKYFWRYLHHKVTH